MAFEELQRLCRRGAASRPAKARPEGPGDNASNRVRNFVSASPANRRQAPAFAVKSLVAGFAPRLEIEGLVLARAGILIQCAIERAFLENED